MKIIHFKWGTLTLRWPWITIRNDDAFQISIMGDTVIGFWRYKDPKHYINWQLSFLILGFGLQLTDEIMGSHKHEFKHNRRHSR